MRLLIYLTLLFPLLAAPLARPVATRADPRRATWLLTVTSLALAATSAAALGVVVLAEAVHFRPIASLGHLSVRVLGRRDHIGGPVTLLAAVLFGAAAVSSTVFAVRRGRAIGQAFRLARRLPGAGQVVVTDDPVAEAFALPGAPGRIVVSSGMLHAVGDSGRAVLLVHEREHLRGRHYVFVAVTHLAAAANPLLRPFAAAVEYTVERWADEAAAAAVGDRRLVAETIANAALAAKSTGARRKVAAALGITGGRPRVSKPRPMVGPMPRRVAALLGPTHANGRWLTVALGLLAVLAGLCFVGAARDFHAVLELADKSRMHR